MSYNPSFWQKALSFIIPYNIEKVSSKISGQLEVNLQYGNIVIDSPKANYSFGNLHLVFREALQMLNLDLRKQHKVLILGFGAGSIAHILYNEINLNCRVTGVELDEEIIKLGKKYFPANIFKRSQIIITDAFEYMTNQTDTYDLILVDLFVDTHTPFVFQGESFFQALKQALKPEAQLLMNTMSENSETKENWKKVFSQSDFLKVQENEVLHYKN